MLFIQNAQILSCAENDYENGYIQIEGDCIVQVGSMSHCPPPSVTDKVMDAAGLVACPGFVDAHSHAGLMEEILLEPGDDCNELSDPISPQLRASDGINPCDGAFADALSAGVTTAVIGPGSANPIGGTFCAMKTYGSTMEEMLLRDQVAMKISFGENPKQFGRSKGRAPMTRMATAALLRETFTRASRYASSLSRGEDVPYDFKLEALLPVIRGEMPVKCHAHRADDIETALRIAREFHLKVSIEHATEGYKIPTLLSGLPVCVGPMIGDKSKPEIGAASLQNAAVLAQNGAAVAIISDHFENPAALLPLYASLAVRGGLSPKEALLAITATAAQNCGIDDLVGSLAKGKRADICLFDRFPLDFSAKLVTLVAGGKKIR